MSLKPKTVRRLTLVALIAVLVIGGAFSLLVVRRWQTGRTTARFGAEALALHARGEHYKAMVAANSYVKRASRGDPIYAEVLLAYAQERRLIDSPDGSNIRQAITLYRMYLERRPDDREARTVLLTLFVEAGYFAEARDLVGELLPDGPASARAADLRILQQEALALAGLRTGEPRLFRVLDRIAELSPLDCRFESLRLHAVAQTRRPAEARTYAEALAATHPQDPRAQLLLVIGRMLDRRPWDPLESTCRHASLSIL